MGKMPPILSQDCQLKIVYGSWLDDAGDTRDIIFLGDEYYIRPVLGLASRVAFRRSFFCWFIVGSTAIFRTISFRIGRHDTSLKYTATAC